MVEEVEPGGTQEPFGEQIAINHFWPISTYIPGRTYTGKQVSISLYQNHNLANFEGLQTPK